MSILRNSQAKRYTLREYRELPEDFRAELIEGELYMLAAPSVSHQICAGNVFFQLTSYLRDKSCQALFAPVDVYLDDEEEDFPTVVQPDIIVVCDPNKLKNDGCHGAPDLAIEILSPSNRTKEQAFKYELYRKYGIREYWVMDPQEKLLCTYLLTDKMNYRFTGFHGPEDAVKVEVLDGCTIDLSTVFS